MNTTQPQRNGPDRRRHGDLSFEVVVAPSTIEDEWRSFGETAIGHVFAEFDFVSEWLTHVAPECGIGARIVVARRPDRSIAAILPFGVRHGLGARILEWLGGDQADYQGGLFDRALLVELAGGGRGAAFAAAATAAAGGDVVRLQRQTLELDGLPNPFALAGAQRHHVDAHETSIDTNWESYYADKCHASSRRNDRRKEQRLERMGEVRFIVSTSAEEAEPILEAMFAQKRASLGELGVRGVFASKGVQDFFRALADRPYPLGPSHIAALTCGDTIVATNWGLIRGDRYYYVMHAFSGGAFERASPGRLLLYRLIRWAMANGIRVFDFTIGDEPYKAKWCETRLPLVDATFASNSRGLGPVAAFRCTTAIKRVIKTTPVLWRTVDFARRRLGGTGRQAHPED